MELRGQSGEIEAARLSAAWEELSTPELLRAILERFPARLAVGSAFGKDGVVLLDLLASQGARLPVLFLDTGYHFPETLAYRDRIATEIGVEVVNLRPNESVEQQDATHGPRLFGRDPDLCCRLRKVEPMREALRGFDAWLTGLRRDQHGGRQGTPIVEWQELGDGRGVFKVNPLAPWTRDQVESYLAEHALARNPLWDQGYASLGCAPCTRPVRPGGAEREGRWAGTVKRECGIHLPILGPMPPQSQAPA